MKVKYIKFVIIACLITSCNTLDGSITIDFSSMSTDQLIQIIEEPNSHLFYSAIEEIAKRGKESSKVAPILAQALGYPRRDSFIAGIALISMGKEAKPAIPYLIPIIKNDQAKARAYAIIVLGALGNESECAIPEIAPLLWDNDPEVRGSAAISLDALTSKNLVPRWGKLDPAHPESIPLDVPNGSFTKDARIWWKQEGQYIKWRSNSNNCILPEK